MLFFLFIHVIYMLYFCIFLNFFLTFLASSLLLQFFSTSFLAVCLFSPLLSFHRVVVLSFDLFFCVFFLSTSFVAFPLRCLVLFLALFPLQSFNSFLSSSYSHVFFPSLFPPDFSYPSTSASFSLSPPLKPFSLRAFRSPQSR